MSIETEITRISTNVSETLNAVSEMGGTVPENATSDDMANGVRSIPVGAKIDDSTSSSTTTYSSQKIDSEIGKLNEAIGNKLDATALPTAVNDALAQAKASGEFDGADGAPGKDGSDGAPGADGYTPVRGTDYWTAADQEQIVSDVLAALPTWDGGAY